MWKEFTKIEEIPEGTYLCKVKSHELGSLQVLQVRRQSNNNVFALVGHHFHFDHTILEYRELPEDCY